MLRDRTLFTDAHIIILDKPAGLAVHPGPSTAHSVEYHLESLRLGFQRLPHPAHRLDRDTSGCLVLGRHPKAVKRLSGLFESGAVTKTYWAVVAPEPVGDEGVINAPLLKVSTKADGWRIIVHPKGKPALTRWRVLERQGGRALVEFKPETGRTHQVRVHAATLGGAILGDPVYGDGVGPMQLHARAISIPYREGAAPITATAEVPPHMAALGFEIALRA